MQIPLQEKQSTPEGSNTLTPPFGPTPIIPLPEENMANDDNDDDDEFIPDDDDFIESQDIKEIPVQFPAKPTSTVVPFEPYHMALTKTKVILTWWKSQKRKIIAQVLSSHIYI